MDPVRKTGTSYYGWCFAWVERTEHAFPLTDISTGVGIGMLMFIAMRAIEVETFPDTYPAAYMVCLAGIGCRDVFDRDRLRYCLVLAEAFELEKRPIVPVFARVGFGFLPLLRVLPDTGQILEAKAEVVSLRQSRQLLGYAMIDVRDDTALAAFELLDRAHFFCPLQLLPPFGKLAAKVSDASGLEEKHTASIGKSGDCGDVLPPVNTYPLFWPIRIGNILRHGKAGVPDTLARTPQLDRTSFGVAAENGIKPFCVRRMVDIKRDAFLNTAQQSKADAVGVPNLMQRPVLVIGLKRQTIEALNLRPGAGVTDCLIDPRRSDLNVVKRFRGQGRTFITRHRQNFIRGLGIDHLQPQKLSRLRRIQAEKWKLQSFRCGCHANAYRLSCRWLQDRK